MNKKLKSYKIYYDGIGGKDVETFQVTAGSNAEKLVKDYAESNDYLIKEIEYPFQIVLNLEPLEANALQVAADHFVEFIDDIVSQGEGDLDEREGDKEKQVVIKSLHSKIMAATKESAR